MSLPPLTTSPDGSTPATDQTVIDAELAEWVYHRASNDQGLSLSDIESNATIFPDTSSHGFDATLKSHGYSIGYDGFIYNQATGFCCAVVQEASGNFAIAVRGTDFGNGSLSTAINHAIAGTPSNLPGGDDELDIYQDYQQGSGTLVPSQADDLLTVIGTLENFVPGANIRLVGQSLGGGDA